VGGLFFLFSVSIFIFIFFAFIILFYFLKYNYFKFHFFFFFSKLDYNFGQLWMNKQINFEQKHIVFIFTLYLKHYF
jgi:hypothetical protein